MPERINTVRNKPMKHTPNPLRSFRFSIYALILVTAILSAGCGGGGGGASDAVKPPTTRTDPIDTTAPVISQATAVYDASGKSAALAVSASDIGNGIATVKASITPAGGSASSVSLTYNTTQKKYLGTYSNIPDNTKETAIIYTVVFTVTDKSNNKCTKTVSFQIPGVTPQQPDSTPPAISEASAVYDAAGKSATLAVSASDVGTGIQTVSAVVTCPDSTTVDFILTDNAGSGLYTAVYSNIPENTTNTAQTYAVVFTAKDKSNNTTTKASTFEVPGKVAPPADTTAPLFSQAGAVYNAQSNSALISASVTDEGGLENVCASISLPAGGTVELALQYDSISGLYSATYTNIPENQNYTAVTYDIRITATDKSGNKSTQNTSFQVDGKTPPIVDSTPPSFTELAAEYNAASNEAVLRAKVTDDGSGVEGVAATVTLPSGEKLPFDLVYDTLNNVFTAVYRDIPKNWTFSAKTYTVDFTARDKSGNTANGQKTFEVSGLDVPPPPSQ